VLQRLPVALNRVYVITARLTKMLKVHPMLHAATCVYCVCNVVYALLLHDACMLQAHDAFDVHVIQHAFDVHVVNHAIS
jgi:hypothetical protein